MFIDNHAAALALAWQLTFLCITMKMYRVNVRPFKE
jgi:hypothetical protein